MIKITKDNVRSLIDAILDAYNNDTVVMVKIIHSTDPLMCDVYVVYKDEISNNILNVSSDDKVKYADRDLSIGFIINMLLKYSSDSMKDTAVIYASFNRKEEKKYDTITIPTIHPYGPNMIPIQNLYKITCDDACPKEINKNNPSDVIIEDPEEIEKSIDDAMKSLKEKKQKETNMSCTLNIINTVKDKIESSKYDNINIFKVPKIDIHMNPITHSIIVKISNTFINATMDKDFTVKHYLYDLIYVMIYCSNPLKDTQPKYTSLIIIGEDPLSDECIEYTDMILDLFLDSQKELYTLFKEDPKFILYTKEDFNTIIESSKGSIVAMFDIVVAGEAVTNFKLTSKAPDILIYSPHQKAIDVSEYIEFINHYYKIPEEYPLVGQHYDENGELV